MQTGFVISVLPANLPEKEMRLRLVGLLGIIFALAGCPGIPPVNTATISDTPASAERFLAAQEAVGICTRFPDAEAVLSGFEVLGYQRSRPEFTTFDGRTFVLDFIDAQDMDLKVVASSEGCTIGLEGMTPDQSFQLVQPWVAKFGLVTNESLGQGLSPHAVQAWQAPMFPHSQILASAGRTWHWDGPISASVPGASVRLIYRQGQ
ncbi:MAG: hypothetical protein AAF667_19615 [Pseudomonadota bacterium]